MNTESLFIFLILLLGLVLCSFLAEKSWREGFAENTNNTSKINSTQTTPQSTDASTSSSNTFDNYNHYTGNSTQLTPGKIFYGNTGSTAIVVNNSDGTQTLQIILPGSTNQLIFKQSNTDYNIKNNYTNYTGIPGSLPEFNGPNDETATIINDNNGQQTIKVKTSDDVYYYKSFVPLTTTSTTTTSTKYYGSTGYPLDQSQYTLGLQGNDQYYGSNSSTSVYGPYGTNPTSVYNPYGGNTTSIQGRYGGNPTSVQGRYGGNPTSVYGPYGGNVASVEGPYGGHVTSVEGPYGGHATSVQGPYGRNVTYDEGAYGENVTSVQGPYGGHVTSVEGPYGGHATSVEGPYGRNVTSVEGPYGNTITGVDTNTDYSNSLPQGIAKNQIKPGQEDLYILKSEIVPPVCPMCPVSNTRSNYGSNYGSNDGSLRQEQCPPCPACARCPEPSFSCKKVPNYNAINNDYLPTPVLNDFSQFGV